MRAAVCDRCGVVTVIPFLGDTCHVLSLPVDSSVVF